MTRRRWTEAALGRQLAAARRTGLLDLLVEEAGLTGVEPAWVLGVASRETGIRNVLGDGGHGVGVMQIDVRYHALARRLRDDGGWRAGEGCRALARYGCRLLVSHLAWAGERYPQWGGVEGEGWRKIASAAYNAGRGGAARGVSEGDADRFTTGADYGADVLARTRHFRRLLEQNP